jgi:hypothetical protein
MVFVTQPTEHVVLKCMKLNYLMLFMQYLLTNMEAKSSATELTNFTSVVDIVIGYLNQLTKHSQKQFSFFVL